MPLRSRPAAILTIGTLGCAGVFLLYRFVLARQTSADLGGIEHSVIYHLQRLLDGQPLYSDPERLPYAINQYGPLYYLLMAAVCKAIHLRSDQVLALFAVSRTVSLVLNLAYAALVFTFARRIFAVGKTAALVTAVLAFIFLEPTSYSRPDSLSHLLILLCLFLFFRWMKQPNVRVLATCGILCAISLFAKQNAFVAPLIVGLWLLGHQQFRPLLLFTAAFFFALVLCLGIGHALFGIRNLWQNLVLGVDNGLSLNWFYDQLLKKLFSSFGLVFLFCALLHWKLQNSDPLSRFANFSLLVLFGCATLLAFKWGSTNGYYTEWWTLVFLCTAALWQSQARSAMPVAGALSWFAAVVLAVRTGLIMYPLMEATRPSIREEQAMFYQNDVALCKRIGQYLEPGDKVMINTLRTQSFYVNLLYPNLVLPQFEIVYFTTYHRNVFNYSEMDRYIKAGGAKVILQPRNARDGHFTNNIPANYIPVDSTHAIVVWKRVP